MLTKGLALKELTAARVRELLNYDPESGRFTWRVDRNAAGVRVNAKAGQPAGHSSANGYLQVRIDGRLYYGHRLAFLHVTGAWPATGVDHIDRNRSNNAWANLRSASQSDNMRNRGPNKSNRSGRVGVYWSAARSKWVARIKVEGRGLHIGVFADLADAVLAREAAEVTYFARPSP